MKESQIEVPESVITRFFSSEKILAEFLQKGNKQAFIQLVSDVTKTYKITPESHNQVTELAYIIYERLKSNEHENSLAVLLSE
jgi:hypothetical protein